MKKTCVYIIIYMIYILYYNIHIIHIYIFYLYIYTFKENDGSANLDHQNARTFTGYGRMIKPVLEWHSKTKNYVFLDYQISIDYHIYIYPYIKYQISIQIWIQTGDFFQCCVRLPKGKWLAASNFGT
jgi:hypothetical protein